MAYDIANGLKFLVAKNEARTTDLTLDTIPDGQLVLVNAAGEVLVAGTVAAYDEVKLVVYKNGIPYETPLLHYSEIQAYVVRGQEAKQNFVMYLGYDPSTGIGHLEGDATTNNVLDNTSYNITVRRNTIRERANTDCIYYNKAISYTTGVNATERTLAEGLVKAGTIAYPAFNKVSEIDGWLNVDLVVSVAATNGTQTLTTVQGEFTVTTTQALNVNDYIRIGYNEVTGVAEVHALTHGVYRVVQSLGGNVYKLDRPVLAPSATYTITQWGTLAAAAVATSDLASWGIKFIGQDKYVDAVSNFAYDVFEADIWARDNFVNTPSATVATAPYLGNGVGEEIYEAEYENEFEQKPGVSVLSTPPANFQKYMNADTDVDYNVVSIKYTKKTDFFTAGTHNIVGHIQLALPVSNGDGEIGGGGPETDPATQAIYSSTDFRPVGVVYGLDTWLTAKTPLTYNEEAKLV